VVLESVFGLGLWEAGDVLSQAGWTHLSYLCFIVSLSSIPVAAGIAIHQWWPRTRLVIVGSFTISSLVAVVLWVLIWPTVTTTKTNATMPDPRIIVDATPEYICGLYNGKLDIQGAQLSAPYVGKWMRISGTVENVNNASMDGYFISLREYNGSSGAIVLTEFDKRWAEYIQVIKRGDRVRILGQIYSVGRESLVLVHSELVDP
jgi:tRNA_anti-like